MYFFGAFSGKRVLVTGHTGFKGSWLTSWLLDLGAEVCGYADGVPTTPSLFEAAKLDRRIEHRIGDVRDLAAVQDVVDTFRPDVVLHLAAQAIVSTSYRRPLETLSTNVMGTATVLEALRQVDWPCAVVIVTSDKCYENVEWSWGYRENDHLGGKDVYSASKGSAELVTAAYLHSFYSDTSSPLSVATARAGNVVGGGDWAQDRVVVDCIKAWMDGASVEIRSPKATRPWQHVLEPLSGYLTLAAALTRDRKEHGESYNFGPVAGQNRTVLELIADLAEEWGSGRSAYRVTDDIPFHEAGLLKLNCDKALQRLRWQPTWSYDECLQFTGSWYRRVLRDHEGASSVTAEQIRAYESCGVESRQVWAAEAADAATGQRSTGDRPQRQEGSAS